MELHELFTLTMGSPSIQMLCHDIVQLTTLLSSDDSLMNHNSRSTTAFIHGRSRNCGREDDKHDQLLQAEYSGPHRSC